MSTYEETVWLILPGRGAPARYADKNITSCNLSVDSGTKKYVIF
jgi:hypothetical protein